MNQVLTNLTLNDRDAMPRGGAFRIDTAVEAVSPVDASRADIPAGDYVTLSVRDKEEPAATGPSLAFALSTVTLKPQGPLTITKSGSTSTRSHR